MKKQPTVDVFLGHPLVDRTEQHFLRRLRRDLASRGVRATVLGNIEVGRSFLQLDFVIISEERAVVCELKGCTDPVIGRPNGNWEKVVDGVRVPLDGNPYRQAEAETYALSDTMHKLAAADVVPGPRKRKFFKELDSVVCLFPAVPAGSQLENHPHVKVVGYGDLLARLQRPGRKPVWSDRDWEAFIREVGLFRLEEDSKEGRAQRVSAAAADEYRARFLRAGEAKMPPLVPTRVRLAGAASTRPDLASDLEAGQALLLRGASGVGKTLWARAAANSLARMGHIPIWLQADAFDGDFETFVARAVAPYTTHSPAQLVAAAESSGRTVAFIVDGLNECPPAARTSLLSEIQTARLRSPTAGLLITTQQAEDAPNRQRLRDIELLAPDERERRLVLEAYGGQHIVDKADGLTTPLELSLAAQCAPAATSVELLDRYVDHVAGGERTRAFLRWLAWRMHGEVKLALSAPEVVRTARREFGLGPNEVDAGLDSPLLTVDRGRVRFRHERFARFLAAEALVLAEDQPETLLSTLNEPQSVLLRDDAIALEDDPERLSVVLSGLEDSGVLASAATGQLGTAVAEITQSILADTLRCAAARTTTDGVRFIPDERGMMNDSWELSWTATRSDLAQLRAAGQCAHRGEMLRELRQLLERTDAVLASVAQGTSEMRDRAFAAVAHGTRQPSTGDVLPASVVIQACVEERFRGSLGHTDSPDGSSLAQDLDAAGPAVLYVAANLLTPLAPECASLVPPVVEACLASGIYHVQLEGLRVAEHSVSVLNGEERDHVLGAVQRVDTRNLFLSTAVVDALSALDAISPTRTVEDVEEEIRVVLRDRDDEFAWQRASGMVSSQFENPDVVGPYFEAVSGLNDDERRQLLAMALRGGAPDDIHVGWVVEELADLSDGFVRSTYLDFVGKADPSVWHSIQIGMGSVMRAVGRLAEADLPLPALEVADGAWRSFLDVVHGVMRSATGNGRSDNESVAWERLIGEHRDCIADILAHLRSSNVLNSPEAPDTEALILQAMPPEGVEALVWSLEHPDSLRSPFRWSQPEQRARYTMEQLGQVGDQAAAGVMRRLANDPQVGQAAVAAVHAIEDRMVSRR